MLFAREADSPLHPTPHFERHLRNRPNLKTHYTEFAEGYTSQACDWIRFDKSTLTATVTNAPTSQDISLPVEIGRVLKFMAR